MLNKGKWTNSSFGIIFSVVLLFFIQLSISNQIYSEEKPEKDKFLKKVDQLVLQQDFNEAEFLCYSYVAKSIPKYYLYIGDIYIKNNAIDNAIKYFLKLNPKKQEENQGIYERLAICYELKKDWQKVLKYGDLLSDSVTKFIVYEKLAEAFLEKGDEATAKFYYEKMIVIYQTLFRDTMIPWKNEYCALLRRATLKLSRLQNTPDEKEKKILLSKILLESSKYVDKMKKSSIYFFCEEDIMEIYDVKPPQGKQAFKKNHFVYEYQLIQEEDKLEEKRKSLSITGDIEDKYPTDKLKTTFCRYSKLLFGPIDLLINGNQSDYYYQILKEDTLWDEPVWVIEAIPFVSYELPSGIIYIDKKDYSVLRLEWNPRTIRFFDLIRDRASKFNAKPIITFFSEFKIKKNGIRFPSKYYLRESYEVSYLYDRLILDVKLKNYTFFIVGSEVTDQRADSGEDEPVTPTK